MSGLFRQSYGRACDQAEEIMPQKRVQIDDVLVPQILNEIVEVVKAVKNAPQERISGKIGEQIDDDIVPSINQVTKLAARHRPVVMQREVPQIRTVLKTVELCRIPNPISQNLLLKDLRKWRNAPDTGAADTGADDKDPETAGPGLETAGLGAGSANLSAG